MNLQSLIFIFNLLFVETRAYNLFVSQSTPKITQYNQTISQFNSTFKFNTTLQIEGEGFKFLIVEFQQTSSENSTIALLFNEYIPTYQINYTMQFKDMDYDSYTLKKYSHYLLIANLPNPKFITILSNVSISFDLTLTGSNESKCLNNCSNNGNCLQGKCICNSNFIGKDCSFAAIELEIQNWRNQTLSNYETFFYYEQQEMSKELDLILYTDSQKNLSILEIVSSIIYLPTLKFYDLYEQFNNSIPFTQIITSKGLNDFDKNNTIKEYETDDQVIINGELQLLNDEPSRLIIVILCDSPNTQLSILLQKSQNKSNKQDILKWLLPTIVGVIIFSIGGILLLKWCLKISKQKFLNYYEQVKDVYACNICDQKSLQNNKDIIFKSKICKQNHTFHKICLINFYKKDPKFGYCPTCAQQFQIQQTDQFKNTTP